MNGLLVLRRVDGIDPAARANIDGDQKLIEMQDGSLWVNNDQPWDADLVGFIMEATQGFMVTDEHYGKVAGPWRDLKKAEAARASAKITVVSVIDADEDEENETDELAAPSVGRAKD